MKKNKKILILVKSVDGGTGTFVLTLMNVNKVFKEKDVRVRVLALEKPKYRKLGITEFNFFRKENFYPERYTSFLDSVSYFSSELIWIKREISEYKPDTVIGIDVHCNLLISILSLFTKKFSTILTTHIDLETTIEDKSSPLISFLLKRAIAFFYNKADALVCSSEKLAEDMKKSFGISSKIVTIYDARSLSLNTSFKRFNKNGKKIIATIARLTEQKDYPTLIKAFNLVQMKFPSTELWIISDGPQKEMLRNLVKKNNLSEKIKFLGWVENIFYYLRKTDIFAFSSKREGFAYVLVEAMSQGIPIVSTNTPFGPSEVLGDGKYGLLVPVGDGKSLSQSIETLLTDKDKYNFFAEKSLERGKFFSEERMLEEYKNLILKLLN